MADGCDPSPHPAKRRKTYASGRTVAKSPEGYGTLFGVSSALSTLSNKLLGRMKPQLEQVLHDDSAYGSKEESLNEDENVVVGEQKKVMPENAPEEQNEDGTAPGRKTRRSSRTSVNSCKVLQQKPVRTTTTDVTSNQTWKENNSPGSEMKTPQPVKSRASGNGRSTRKSSPAEEKSHAQRRKDNVLVDTQPFTSKKRMSKASSVDAMTSDVIGSEDADEGDAGPPNGKLNGHIEETVETKQRLSGRERRKPRRFSVEPAPAKGPLLIGEAAQEDPVVSPAKASSVLASPQPKGILTPSRRRREGPRKSVVFDENDKTIEERLGFKDIESPSKKARKNVKEYAEIAETPQSAAAEEDEDDLFVDQNPPKDHLQTLELPSYSEDLTTTDRPADPPAVTAIKALVLSRLTSTSLPSSPPSHLATQYSTLHSLLTSTIAASESNSLLLLGSRGSGKSMLIGTALTDLSSKHKEDFHIVRLDGFFQTDDRLALREIWRQLGREREGLGELDENETAEVGGSYADTMASLLSLLSHPDDFDADPIAMDLDPPTNQARASKSVIIILDEFDLFTLHPRQTLLYNLFDIAQSKKAPIAVIGCSTRMDVVECLEKRVKSRFSHRWVHVPTVKSAEGMEDIVKRVLCMEDGGPANVDMEDRVRWNEYIKVRVRIPLSTIGQLMRCRPHLFLHLKSRLSYSRPSTPQNRYQTFSQHCISPLLPFPSQPQRSHLPLQPRHHRYANHQNRSRR